MINTVNTGRFIGLILLIAAIACYYFQPLGSSFFDVLAGIAGAIGLGLLLGWIRKR